MGIGWVYWVWMGIEGIGMDGYDRWMYWDGWV